MPAFTLSKVAGRYNWKTHYMTQFNGVVFVATRMEYDMPVRCTSWRIEASRPVLFGRSTYDVDTLADVRQTIADAFDPPEAPAYCLDCGEAAACAHQDECIRK